MLNLMVVKPLTYISPSTLITWRKCQNRIYQAKMAGHPYIPRKSSKAAAIGTAVDAFVKHAIISRRNETFPETKSLQYIFNKMILEDGLDKEAIVKEGRALTKAFVDRGFLKEFIDPANKVQLDVEAYRICDGIPLLGIIDIIINGVPLDLKTRGFGKNAKTYSHGGYERKLTRDGALKQGIQELLESKNKDWATQLYFYARILDMQKYSCRIVEMCNQGDGQFEVAFHRSTFTPLFSTKTNQDIFDMWIAVSGLECQIKEPEPSWHCREYGTLCEVASRCPKFMATLAADVGVEK